MGKSKIEWTEETWNPVTGCTKVSEGCRHCYAERMARRLAGRFGYPEDPHHFDVTLHPERLEEPLHWRKPRTVFVCSMSDWAHPQIPIPFLSKMFCVMESTPQHTYLLLTKRVHEMRDYILEHQMDCSSWPAPHIHLGVTIESPNYCYRAEYLRETPASTRFVSFEPLLASFADYPGVLDDIDWVIAGGESGPGARPMHPNWARSLRDQCQAAGIPFFFKQWGHYIPEDQWDHIKESDGHLPNPCSVFYTGSGRYFGVGKGRAGRLLDGRTWDEMPTTQT